MTISRQINSCHWQAEAATAATDAAHGRQPDAAYMRHLDKCDSCAALLRDRREMVDALLALPQAETVDLVSQVMSQIDQQRPAFNWRRGLTWTAAAAAMLVLTFSLLRPQPQAPLPAPAGASVASLEDQPEEAPPSFAAAHAEAVAWLVAQQQADGRWDVAALGGRRQHEPALTALALLAIRGEHDKPVCEQALERGIAALVAMQNPDGSFGGDGDFRMYNHGMATTALLRLWDCGAASHHDALDSAVAFTRRAQQLGGGWGYQPGDGHGQPNASVSAWQLEALGLARQHGWGDPQGHLRRGLWWLSRLADSRGVVGYHQPGDMPSTQVTTTALGVYSMLEAGQGIDGVRDLAVKMARRLTKLVETPDLVAADNPYRDYFASRASEACASANFTKTARPDVTGLRGQLVARRISDGETRGTWNPGDAYAEVGGRLYTTSLAAMALRE